MRTILLLAALLMPSKDDQEAAKNAYHSAPIAHRLYVRNFDIRYVRTNDGNCVIGHPNFLDDWRFYVDETESVENGVLIHLHPEGTWNLGFRNIGYEQGLYLRLRGTQVSVFYTDFHDYSGRIYEVRE